MEDAVGKIPRPRFVCQSGVSAVVYLLDCVVTLFIDSPE